jgi:hypothetical protein
MTVSSPVWFVLLMLAVVLIAVRTFTPQRPIEHPEAAAHHGRRSGIGPVALILLAGVLLLGLRFVGTWKVSQSETQTAVASSRAEVSVLTEFEITEPLENAADGLPSVLQGTAEVLNAVSEGGLVTESSLPAWTHEPETTLVAGQVPTVRRVVSSGLYATQDEATQAACLKVQNELRSRLAPSYPQLADWTIPQPTLQMHCIRQTHVEVRETQFGQFKEPMYQVWLQYEDSPHVREPIVAEWERSAVDGRTVLFAAGAGLAALFLGTVSAGVRTMIAPPGSKGRSAFATVALGAGTGLAALTLFVG